MRLANLSWVLLFSLVTACGDKSSPEKTDGSSPAASTSPPPSSASASVKGPASFIERDADHVGGVIARAPASDSVFIADEDHSLLRFIADTSPLLDPKAPAPAPEASAPAPPKVVVVASATARPATPAKPAKPYSSAKSAASEAPTTTAKAPKPVAGEVTIAQESLALGGAPANLVAVRDGVLVTVRDPGKLVRVRKGDDGKLSIVQEVALPADAWGLALNEAGTRALVTSAWTGAVSLIEIREDGLKKCAEVSVGREPRGVAFASDSIAYVNHLVGNEITRLSIGADCGAKGIGEVKRVVVPPSPARSPAGKVLPASLGYSIALSPDKKRLYAPRHALGARSHSSWFGAATVDQLLLPAEAPATPMHEANLPGVNSTHLDQWGTKYEFDNQPVEAWSAFIQPRDIRYRRSLNTVLVVSEGADRLVELDALAMDPAYAIGALYELSDSVRRAKNEADRAPQRPGSWQDGWRRETYVDPSSANASDNKSCAAPQGAVLDAREEKALVFCRASTTIVAVALQKKLSGGETNRGQLSFASLGPDAAGLNLGRRLFYSAVMAEGMGCAGCHPEGRDDGHVWREIQNERGVRRFVGGDEILGPAKELAGVPRRTPMLVGRVLPVGPYGWLGESETLEKRIMAGTQLHAGSSPPSVPDYYVNAVAVFIRKGLTRPPKAAPLTPEEQRGKALFEDAKTACTACHEPTRYYSNFTPTKLPPLPTLAGFEPEPDALFKTPSLLYVGRRGSLFHDGSAKTLEDLIEKNGTRMGDTAHLSLDERKALVAYLKTL